MTSDSVVKPALRTGFVLWAIGTIALRVAGHWLLPIRNSAGTVTLYLISFALMAWLIPRLCRGMVTGRDSWFEAAGLLVLPTLVLDPFSAAFFPGSFPTSIPALLACLADGC